MEIQGTNDPDFNGLSYFDGVNLSCYRPRILVKSGVHYVRRRRIGNSRCGNRRWTRQDNDITYFDVCLTIEVRRTNVRLPTGINGVSIIDSETIPSNPVRIFHESSLCLNQPSSSTQLNTGSIVPNIGDTHCHRSS